jgi:tRNA threonylcarbamoyladenosine biosynthesis protein TsaE
LGQKLGQELKGGEVFLLTGDLGGGKTQFTKGLALGLGIKEPITSPTFIYENIYNGQKLKLYHFDLYRSEVIDEDVKDLMLEAFEDQKGVTVVEWAERAKDYWPSNYYHFDFKWLAENEREIIDKSRGIE